jgi:hypothetical protein
VKRVFALFLVLLFCGKFIYTSFWLIYFQINQREIIRLSCENKNRPELKCNGKCYLAKQLRKAEFELASRKSKQETQLSLIKQLEIEGYYFPSNVYISSIFSIDRLSGVLKTPYSCPNSSEHKRAIFHPPII